MKDKTISNKENWQNCHIPKTNTSIDTGADQDSSRSKYVVEEDHRKRQDGPGGN
ncbi:MAG: hypothetical protein UHS41_05780 [Lachnospiraceae bacterium]|nr:hypothetical protein [Lachnospiraceae bacterium]